MRSPLYYRSNMRHRMASRRLLFPADFQLPPRTTATPKPSQKDPLTVYDAWLASREVPGQPGHYLVPGAPRPLTLENARLALFIGRSCTLDFVSLSFCSSATQSFNSATTQFKVLFELNPFRTTLMMTLSVVRSLFPAFRGYSQALIVDEVRLPNISENFQGLSYALWWPAYSFRP
jgi:hypothetical protein